MAELHAWRINQSDVWAGATAEAAVAAACTLYGLSEADLVGDYVPHLVEPATQVAIEDGPPDLVLTVGEILATMKAPGLVCSSEV